MEQSSDDNFRGILYIFDSLRFDYLGCYGHDKNITPNLDTIADDGARFKDAYSQAIWTYPSAGSIFTGLYPQTHGSQQFDQPLNSEHPHIADGFNETEITTACFSTTLGISEGRGFKQGFDEFYHIDEGKAGLRPDVMDILNDELLPWVKTHSDSSFFIVVWAMGTHHPYRTPDTTDTPSEPLRSKKGSAEWLSALPQERVDEVRNLYNNVIKYSDERFGELVDVLRAEGIYDETDLLVTSDHGEVFDEHARLEHVSAPTKTLLEKTLGREQCREYGLFTQSAFIGHQAIFPYEELIHVPLLFKPSHYIPSLHGAVEYTTELVDLLPTVYETAGLPLPDGVQGTSIFEYTNGETNKELVFTHSQIHKGNIAYSSVQNSKYKLCKKHLVNLGVKDLFKHPNNKAIPAYFLGKKNVLLDLDNTEKRVEDGAIEARLSKDLLEHVRSCKNRKKTAAVPDRIDVDSETERHLANLGYK